MNKNPWVEQYVEQRVPSAVNVTDITNVLNGAKDEKPLQDYLAKVPAFLRQLVPASNDFWCFDRPSFAGLLIPDFLLCYRNSRGFNWVLVELESPSKAPLIASGRPSGKLNEAISQISDWRVWLRDNVSYARDQLGFRQIDAEAHAIIIIGRRAHVNSKHAVKYRSQSSNTLSVMSYDRLLEIQTD